MIAELLPSTTQTLDRAAASFNRAYAERVSRAVDFLKLHYALSSRPERFWDDNRDRSTWTDSLADLIEQWRQRPPNAFDLSSIHQGYPVFSYQAVLYGMGFRTGFAGREAAYPHREAAQRAFARIASAAEQAALILPDHRALIEQIYARADGGGAPRFAGARS
jgi:tryptophan halogenase